MVTPPETAARTVLVTGGTRGIGAAVTRELLARGRNVGCGYRENRDHAEKLAADNEGRVLPVRYELGDEQSARSAVADVLRRWSRLDGVVVNAGQWRGGRLTDMDPRHWWDVVESNVHGMAQLARAALPALSQGTDPGIVLVSSVVGIIGHAGDTAYASAKAAMVGFARSLAKEVGRDGIRVNVLAPGFVDTDMTANVPTTARERIASSTVLRRFGGVEEIARAAVFLCDDATYCTGSVLSSDGGWSL